MSLTRPVEVAAIYCPLWHGYDHMSAWKREGWCEWELVKAAPARFDSHYQPLRPSWGCFDESDPSWAAREIDLAAENGVGVFLFDWYWYGGVQLMQEALERGFLRGGNRSRLQFAIMWANHDWADYFPAPFGKPWNSWLPMRHTPRDFDRVLDYCAEHYFRQPNYWRVEGRLFFSVFNPRLLLAQLGGPAGVRPLLDRADRRLQKAGLPSLHWNAMTADPALVADLTAAGFHSTTCYNVIDAGRTSPELTQNYADLMEAHAVVWERMRGSALPHAPVVTMGWDVTPRCEHTVPWPFPVSPLTGRQDYPYGPVVLGNTPERFGELCARAADFAAGQAGEPSAVFVNAWNEWTEGSYLLPEERTGVRHLEALKRALER